MSELGPGADGVALCAGCADDPAKLLSGQWPVCIQARTCVDMLDAWGKGFGWGQREGYGRGYYRGRRIESRARQCGWVHVLAMVAWAHAVGGWACVHGCSPSEAVGAVQSHWGGRQR